MANASVLILDWVLFSLSYSGDGTLSIFNIRRQKIEQRSDNMESELLSVAVVKVRDLVVYNMESELLPVAW